jgi:hypothetical protein
VSIRRARSNVTIRRRHSDSHPRFFVVVFVVIVSSISYCRHQYPPRTLLDLIDEDVMSRTLILQRATSISMFQSVRAWTVASPFVMSPLGPFQDTRTRAKLASGVPLLIDTVGSDWRIHRQRIRSARFLASGRKPLSKLQKLKRLILGE